MGEREPWLMAVEKAMDEKQRKVQDYDRLKQELDAERIKTANLKAELGRRSAKEKHFPVLDAGFSVPWEMVVPFAQQAFTNHEQSLERLAQRGGLDPSELWCIVHGKTWRERTVTPEQADAWAREWASLGPVSAAVLKEREECAKIAESGGCSCNFGDCPHDEAGQHIAALIRGRKP